MQRKMSGFTIQVNSTTITAAGTTNSLQVYNCLVDVVRIAKTSTARGVTEVPTNILTNMPARIRWTGGRERLQFDKQTHYRDATLHCRKGGVTITTKDRIKYNDEMFEIVDVQDFRNLGKLLKIGLKRIE